MTLPDDPLQSETAAPLPPASWSPIVELRQYALNPGRRDELISLFDSEFVESQEAAGMKIIGQFRDLDDDNRFVWVRGFSGMTSRARGLGAFYDGPVWHEHRDAANATMIDSDDVLLLRPARPDAAFVLDEHRQSGSGPQRHERRLVSATVVHMEAPAEKTGIMATFEQEIAPEVMRGAGSVLAYFVSASAENNFPRLPVREGEHVFVWFTGHESLMDLERGARNVGSAVSRIPGQVRAPQKLRLAPTSRSLLHGGSSACEAMPSQR